MKHQKTDKESEIRTNMLKKMFKKTDDAPVITALFYQTKDPNGYCSHIETNPLKPISYEEIETYINLIKEQLDDYLIHIKNGGLEKNDR